MYTDHIICCSHGPKWNIDKTLRVPKPCILKDQTWYDFKRTGPSLWTATTPPKPWGDFCDFGTKTGIFPCQDLMWKGKNHMDIRSHLLLLSRARIHLQKMMNNSVHAHYCFLTESWLLDEQSCKEVAITWSYEKLMCSRARIALSRKVEQLLKRSQTWPAFQWILCLGNLRFITLFIDDCYLSWYEEASLDKSTMYTSLAVQGSMSDVANLQCPTNPSLGPTLSTQKELSHIRLAT